VLVLQTSSWASTMHVAVAPAVPDRSHATQDAVPNSIPVAVHWFPIQALQPTPTPHVARCLFHTEHRLVVCGRRVRNISFKKTLDSAHAPPLLLPLFSPLARSVTTVQGH
jgi:hypothetical protein